MRWVDYNFSMTDFIRYAVFRKFQMIIPDDIPVN
jgi:hypothetical protein